MKHEHHPTSGDDDLTPGCLVSQFSGAGSSDVNKLFFKYIYNFNFTTVVLPALVDTFSNSLTWVPLTQQVAN